MSGEILVCRATPDKAQWIVDLSMRVQAGLNASRSHQHIGPLRLQLVDKSCRDGHAFTLEASGRQVGSVLVDPLDGSYPATQRIDYLGWGVDKLPGPLWYLHALMLEPSEQGKRLGLRFLDGVRQLIQAGGGTVVLDCWSGNAKLRDFYQRAGFVHHGNFPEDVYNVAVFYLPLQRISNPG